ncbi:MAG: DUF4127 family protein [Cyanobacteriota bacterium]
MLFIPIDNRPVSYDLAQHIAKVGGINISMPPKEMLGGLTYQADFESLREWTYSTIKSRRLSSAVIALDTIAYGGLVPSRWSEDYFEDIINRINTFLQLFKMNNINVYAYSSVMRISNNNNNEEEKDYWSEYGTKIYQYSNLFHKVQKLETPAVQEQLNQIIKEIPQEILEDYVSTRERNFEINQYYIEKTKQNSFELLVYCQDDTSKWGINVLEAESLRNSVVQNKLQNKILIHPGTDEIGASLLVRAAMWPNSLSIYPIYTLEAGKEILANYEDRPIKKSVEGQIKICGAKKSNSIGSADLVLVIHLPEISQGDHIFDIEPEGTSENALSKCLGLLQSLNKPVAIADILWANGSDPNLIEKMFDPEVDIKYLYGYAGWNTASNSIGSTISMGLMRVQAEKEGKVNKLAHKKLLISRLVDDWAYQSIIRKKIDEPDVVELNNRMHKIIDPLLRKFDYNGEITFRFPWNRLFEIEAIIK